MKELPQDFFGQILIFGHGTETVMVEKEDELKLSTVNSGRPFSLHDT